MFTEIRTQRHAASVMSDLGERDPRNESSRERRETAPARGLPVPQMLHLEDR